MKKILSLLICICMLFSLMSMGVTADEPITPKDYCVTNSVLTDVRTVLEGVAEVTKEGDTIVIKLTSDINGCLHIGENSFDNWSGAFVLDLNGKTIDPGSSLNEAICLDNNFEGSLTLTGSGTIKTGIHNIIYTWDANICFAVADGYDYFTLKIDEDSEKYTVTQQYTYRIRGSELVVAQGRETSDKIYAYAYDVQRGPDFPSAKGDEIKVRSFKKPLNRDEEEYSLSAGMWTLSEVGTYGEKSGFVPTPNSYLDGIINSVATKYELDDDGKNGLVIHKLVDENSELVGYGVVIAVDETNGYTLFVADIWGNSGAGYLLSSTEIPQNSGSITLNAEEMAQSTYSVALDQKTISFAEEQEGYSVPEAKTVTITNTGDAACGALNISLSGDSDSKFILSKDSIDDIAVGENDTFTIVPKAGLSAGTYTETITIKGDKVMLVTATVSFTVNTAPAHTVVFDANGGTVEPATATTEVDGTITSLPTPTRGSCRFDGWYTDGIGGTQVTVDNIYTEDTIIYAHWTYIGGSGGGGSKFPTRPVKVEDKTEPEKEPEKVDTTKPEETVYFVDVNENDWFFEDVNYVAKNKLMNGIAENKFAPEDTLTRAMLVTVLYRNAGEPAVNRSIPFADVDMGSWYANAVIWAQQNGIVNGVNDTKFAPDDNITREQIAAIMFRYAQYKGMNAVTLEENLHFDDADKISEYAVSAMNWAVGTGLIKGKTASTINPEDNATRAEIAAILHRFVETSK